MSKTRVTGSVLSPALLQQLQRRALERRVAAANPDGAAAVLTEDPAPELRPIEFAADDKLCAVPLPNGTPCLQRGVLADPQTGRWRCLHHVHTLGDVC